MDYQSLINFIENNIKYLIYGIGFGLGIYFARYITPVFLWLKGGIENQDGKLQNKDLQIVFVSIIVAFIVVTSYLGKEYNDAIIWGGWATLAGLYGIKEIYGNKNGNI